MIENLKSLETITLKYCFGDKKRGNLIVTLSTSRQKFSPEVGRVEHETLDGQDEEKGGKDTKPSETLRNVLHNESNFKKPNVLLCGNRKSKDRYIPSNSKKDKSR